MVKFRGLAKQFEGGCEMVRLDQPRLEGVLEAAVEDAWRSKPALGPRLLQAAGYIGKASAFLVFFPAAQTCTMRAASPAPWRP